jgi:hypothetical protein
MPPAKSLAVVLAVLTLTVGCVGPPGTGSGSATATPEPSADTATPTPDPDPATGTDGPDTGAASAGTRGASNQPDPDKTVQLENAWNQSVEIRISVVREAANETVHEGTYTLDPGTEREVYDVADADPDGVESFRVTATARNATRTVTIETSACSTDAYVEITSSGDLYPFRGVC